MHHMGYFDITFIAMYLLFALIRVSRDHSNKCAKHIESRGSAGHLRDGVGSENSGGSAYVRHDECARRDSWSAQVVVGTLEADATVLGPDARVYEPCYESGQAVRLGVGMADHSNFAVAGLWREWETREGPMASFTQLTMNPTFSQAG